MWKNLEFENKFEFGKKLGFEKWPIKKSLMWKEETIS